MFHITVPDPRPALCRVTGLARLADRAERLVWQRHDTRAVAAGMQVTRTGRWTRQYRDPRLAMALAAIAARAADQGAACAPNRSERAA